MCKLETKEENEERVWDSPANDYRSQREKTSKAVNYCRGKKLTDDVTDAVLSLDVGVST